MKRVMQYIYGVCLLVCAVLTVYIFSNFHLERQAQDVKQGYEVLQEQEYLRTESAEEPGKVQLNYIFTMKGIQASYRVLLFHTIHQNVEVYLEEQLIYSMRASEKNAFNKSPGCVWNEVVLSTEDNGKQLRISLEPVYPHATDTPEFYLGTKYDIAGYVLLQELPAILISLFVILMGILFVAFVLYTYRNSQVDKSLMMLGIFSINIAVWKLMDMNAIKFLYPDEPALSLQPYLSLMLIPIPFVLFLKEVHQSREHWLWYVPCVVSAVQILTVVVLQVQGIMDFRESLLSTHAVLVFSILICIIMMVREVLTVGWNQKLRMNVFGVVFCCVGLFCDMIIYYNNAHGNTFLGILCFAAYVMFIGVDSVREGRRLIDIGMRASKFERMAYHDQLTGLYNRTAYADYTSEEDFDPDRCIVVMVDLNELKQCNDVLGHEQGDIYIRESAQALQEVFGEYGKCYRMGGDEFCVLLKGMTLAQCRNSIQEVRRRLTERNRKYPEIRMEFACGYELYDKRIDYDIGDTSRRADRMMYEEKFRMKNKA